MNTSNTVRPTERDSHYTNLENLSISELLSGINQEDKTVALSVEKALPQIESLCEALITKLKSGGRLFYLGAGTSGRLGIVDASELPPTYGVSFDLAIGLIAGGDGAIRRAVEFAEDDLEGGVRDLLQYNVSKKDFVIGIAASGTTPYVLGAVEYCNKNDILTGCVCCNANSPIVKAAKYPVAVEVGPEFVTGSTRMKAGTAQKMVLNMISTTAMIRLGKVKGNKMVDMQLTNNKLIDRGTRMIIEKTGLEYEAALALLNKFGNVRDALNAFEKSGTK